MEFRFDLNDIFEHPVVEVGNSLIPPGFSGDKRALWDTQSKVTQIVNAMGEASAHAQGLSKPITTADRLRNSEHRLYLLVDQSANNGKGAVTGMLKTGEKGLYVFDREGQHYQVSPPCVLDFYIHESRQRSGFGKRLFEHMLQKEQIEPIKMAIDRPSDKFLGFLNKHYGLHSPVKQMNNYVVFDEFFPRSSEPPKTVEADKSYTPSKKQSANGLQAGYASSPYGRYGAPRPTCSMGQIIHNDSPVIKRNQEPAGVRSEPVTNVQGQGTNYYNSNQPAWQTTQSTPNMYYGYTQNQQTYNPNQMAYLQNQQYPQNQTSTMSYPANSGVFQNAGQYEHGNVPLPQNNVYQNYIMAQGDAGQMYKQDMMAQNLQPNQMEYTNQNIPPQFMTPQQYQMSPQPNQQTPNATPSYAEAPQHYNRGNVSRPTKTKEPLIPQHFDGTLRKTPHAVQSTPVQGANQASAVVLQNSASAPVNYQHPSMNNSQQNVPAAIHMGNANNTVAASILQRQTDAGQVAEQHMPTQSFAAPVNYQQPPVDSQQVGAAARNQADQQMTTQPFAASNYQQPSFNSQLVGGAVRNQADQQPFAAPVNYQQPPVNNQQVGVAARNLADQQMTTQSFAASVNYQQPSAANSQQQVGVQNQPYIAPQIPTQTRMSQVANYGMDQAISQMPAQNQYVSVPQAGTAAQNQQGLPTPSVHMIQQSQPNSQVNHQQQNSLQQMGGQPAEPQYGTNQLMQMTDQYQNVQQVQSIPQVAVSASSTTPVMHQNAGNNQYPVANQIQHTQAGQQHANDEHQSTIVPHQGVVSNQPEMNRFVQKVAVGSHSVPRVNLGTSLQQETREMVHPQEVDLSKGYPPQHFEISAQNSTTPKADRPNSLNIEPAEEAEQKTNEDREAENFDEEEALDGQNGDLDSLDGDAVQAIEREIQKVEIAPKASTPLSRGSRSPGIEAAGIVTPGRSTPGLTDQGYFDLKFYHNKLW